MPGLFRGGYRAIPSGPDSATPQQQSTVYDKFYGQMPIPATQYAMSDTPLRSVDIQPSVQTAMSNASIVQRANQKWGMSSTGGYGSREEDTPQLNKPVPSSKFQDWLIGPQTNYSMNSMWYIAYPAATVMFGGQHNLALSERVPQLVTRTTGGPGPGSMRQAPRFKSVQTVPRYSTMPTSYKTSSAQG